MLKIPVILGTAREGRQSEKVARFVRDRAAVYGFDSELVDVRDYLQMHTEEKPMEKWKAKAAAADGFIIVSPEYNHGYPGELKIFLDSAYDEYARKPLAIVGVSSGLIGGARMIEQLRLVCTELGMVMCRAPAFFQRVKTLFDEQGNLENREEWEKKIEHLCTEVEWYAKALKAGRNASAA
ncbi:MAG: hypothetical protein QOG91_424 [Candidatus Parcubacteria bacterium]|nr:hypothetical protein [Candidatus Parcubacteria bacterium]